jgi:hypothetical protein
MSAAADPPPGGHGGHQKVTVLPENATLCSVNRDASGVRINCIGFVHRFADVSAAAKVLGVDWRQLDEDLRKNQGLAILFCKQRSWHL